VLQSPDGIVAMNVAAFRRLARRRRGDRVSAAAAAAPASAPPVSRAAASRLQVDGLSVTFGTVRALDSVSFELTTGRVLGVIGPNGAGKSTLIDAITGFVSASGGTVTLDGASLDRASPQRRARSGIGRSFQSLELFVDMTVHENLERLAQGPVLGRPGPAHPGLRGRRRRPRADRRAGDVPG
jgi:sulfate-transporting ATPase